MTGMKAPLFFLFVIVLFSTVEGKEPSTEITIIPKRTVVLLDEPVHIGCRAVGFKTVTNIEINKHDGNAPKKLIAYLLSGQSVSDKTLTTRSKAVGRIDNSESFLNVTISPAVQDDSATYTCKVEYLRDGKLVKTKRASDKLVVDEDLHQDHFEIVIKHLLAKNMELTQRMNVLSNEGPYTSAFAATIASSISILEGQVLVFPEVMMQHGTEYNNETGIFTAERAGLFAFHFGFRLDRTNGYAIISIQKNESDLTSAQASDDGYYGHSSCTAVTDLKAGDRVRVFVNWVSRNSKISQRFKLAYFNGHVVKPL